MSGIGDHLAGGLRWSLSSYGYQFFGTEGSMEKTFLDAAVPGRYLPLGNWTFVRPYIKDGNIEFAYQPLVSNLRSSIAIPPNWVYSENPYLSRDEPLIERKLKLHPVHQPDGLGVKKWQSIYQSHWLVGTFAEATPIHSMSWQSGSTSYFWNTGLSDVNYDFSPTVFSSLVGKGQAPDTNWYRGCCLRTVTSETFGTRTFIIMVDIAHNFHSYPIGAQLDYYLDIPGQFRGKKTNVPGLYAKTDSAPLPDWVSVFDVGSEFPVEDQLLSLMPQWVFSPTGHHAAAVMYKKEDNWSDSHINSTRHKEGNIEFLLQESRPGVVEVQFLISLTGNNLEDFTFDVVLNKSLYSGDDGRGYLAVGYAASDINNVSYGDLLILEHKYFIGDMLYDATLFESGSGVYDTDTHVLVRPPIAVTAHVMRGNTEIMTWLSSYFAELSSHHIHLGLTELSIMNPTFDDLSDKPTDDSGYRQICFQTAINSMDLSTLTFCFGASLTMVGQSSSSGVSTKDIGGDILFATYTSPFCASAAYVCTYNLGVVDEERFVGHPQLKSATKDYFKLTNSRPNFSILKQYNLNAEIDSSSIDVPVGTAPPSKIWDLYNLINYNTADGVYEGFNGQVMFADLTIKTGFSGGTQTESIIFASSLFYAWGELVERQLGPNNLGYYYQEEHDVYRGWIPRIFTFFDGQAYERPGLRWTQKEPVTGNPTQYKWVGYNDSPRAYILATGDGSYTNYPLGLILHSRFAEAALTAQNNVYANLSAEPNGSYATFFGPFAAPTSTVITHNDLNQALPSFSSFVLEQNLLDIIKIKLVSNGTYLTGKTSHIEAMSHAFATPLSSSDYVFNFGLSGQYLVTVSKTYAPSLISNWKIGSVYDNNYQYMTPGTGWSKEGQVGGSIFLTPIAMGWTKTFLGNGVDYKQLQTFPVFSFLDLQSSPTPFSIALPTPRMCGIFTKLTTIR